MPQNLLYYLKFNSNDIHQWKWRHLEIGFCNKGSPLLYCIVYLLCTGYTQVFVFVLLFQYMMKYFTKSSGSKSCSCILVSCSIADELKFKLCLATVFSILPHYISIEFNSVWATGKTSTTIQNPSSENKSAIFVSCTSALDIFYWQALNVHVWFSLSSFSEFLNHQNLLKDL